MKYFTCIFILFLTACKQKTSDNDIQGDWIKGTKSEQIKTIEKQFRGFDMTMVETGYRYQELFWAGKDQNWEYANYQLEKIKVTLENGLQRRPKRAKSAEHFFNFVLPEMQKAIQSQKVLAFNASFESMTINCNNCHAMENVPYFIVKEPLERQSPIRK